MSSTFIQHEFKTDEKKYFTKHEMPVTTMTQKSLDIKLDRILADSSCEDFIIADAKDADMAAGMAAPGLRFGHTEDDEEYRTLEEYRTSIRENVEQGLVDIMLMSASTNYELSFQENIFENSHVTPAVRVNDTTDIWMAKDSQYTQEASRPFRSATIDHAMCGKLHPSDEERQAGVNLGLYSMTFNNSVDCDHESLSEYKRFRVEAEEKGLRHFLEVFDPNAPKAPIEDLGRFINDNIARALAGVCGKGRPLFLKIAYHGPEAMEQLVSYDSRLVVGILGGSSGTTLDAFHQLWEAKKYGARVALYGRMINNSEHQPTFLKHLRQLADGGFSDPAEAVMSYHSELGKLKMMPFRKLEDDLVPTPRSMSYDDNLKSKRGNS